MDDTTLDGASPAPVAEWRVGDRVLDQYEITGVHRGGMGVVYRARHSGWDTDVAVKRPHPELFRTAADRERFVREARAWVDLGLHPNVCNCHYVRTLGGVPSVVAEYVAGGSLADWIRDGRLHRGDEREVPARIVDVAVQIAWGLAHAHALGVVHRDVKPANVLIDHDGTVKVTDFGLAGARTATYRGTRRYASPEQAAGDPTDVPTDVWSLAVTVLEMVTGEVTWLAGPAAGAALARADAVPDGLADLLARCFAWDPADRPGSMEEVASELEALHPAGARPRPSSERPRADELNNRALSLLDLGHVAEAEELFAAALAADPRHPEATFNAGVLRWRAAGTTDDVVLADLEAARASHPDPDRVTRLIDLLQRERGTAQPDVTVAFPERRTAAPVCLTPDGDHVLIGDDRGDVRVVELTTGRCTRVLPGHPEPVDAIGVSSDGSRAITVDTSWSTRLWDLATGRLLRTRRSRRRLGDAFLVHLSPDANLVLLRPLFDKTDVKVWEVDRRSPPRTLRSGGRVVSLCADPGGRRLLVGDDSGEVRVWGPTRGGALFPLWGHDRLVGAMAVDSAGRVAVTAAGVVIDGVERADDTEPKVWDLRTGRRVHDLVGHAATVDAVAVTPDGRWALTGGLDRTARWWDLSTGRCLRVLTGHTSSVKRVCFPGDDPRTAATADLDGVIRLWDLADGRCLRTVADGVAWEDEVALTPDFLVHAGKGAVRVWRLRPTPPSPLQVCRSRTAVELSSVGSRVADLLARAAEAERDGDRALALDLVRQARAQPGHERSRENLDAWHRLAADRGTFGTAWPHNVIDSGTTRLTDVCTTPDGRNLLHAGHEDNTVRVAELPSGEQVATLTGHTGRVRAIRVDPTGRFAVGGGEDGTALVWDLRTREVVCRLVGHDGSITSVCTTPDGRHAVTGSVDATARVWSLPTGEPVWTLAGHNGPVRAVAVAPDGRSALTACDRDGGVRQWDLATGRCTGFPETYPGTGPESMSVTSTGLLLTTASGRGRVRDLLAPGPARAIDVDRMSLPRLVHAAPNGGFALLAGSGEAVRVWDPVTGRLLGRLEGHPGGVRALCTTPDGRYIVVAGVDGLIRVWEIDWEVPV